MIAPEKVYYFLTGHLMKTGLVAPLPVKLGRCQVCRRGTRHASLASLVPHTLTLSLSLSISLTHSHSNFIYLFLTLTLIHAHALWCCRLLFCAPCRCCPRSCSMSAAWGWRRCGESLAEMRSLLWASASPSRSTMRTWSTRLFWSSDPEPPGRVRGALVYA